MNNHFVKLVTVFTSVLMIACNSPEKPSQNNGEDNKIIAVATFVDHVVLNKIRDSFKSELQELGYTKDKGWDIVIKSANGQPNEAGMIADELINMNPEVIVSISTPSTKPIYDKNQGQIPHVYSFVSFPEEIGITERATNTTGLSDGVDFDATFMLIKNIVPNLKKIGMVYSDEPNAIISQKNIARISAENQVQFIGQAISREDEVKSAAQTILNQGVDAMIVGADGVVVNQVNALVEVTKATKVPLFATDEGSVENGALAAYSVNYEEFGRATAKVTDKVIKNGSTKDIEQIKYYGESITLNRKTSVDIGIVIPKSIEDSAKIIE